MVSKTLIVIPTRNEKENISRLIPAIFDYLPNISVLIVDDRSKDGTEETVVSLKEKFTSLFILERDTNFGYGRAILDGLAWAVNNGFEFIVTMDADFSHDHKTVPKILDMLDSKDVVLGSRYIKGGQISNWSFSRKILSRFANYYVRFLLGLNFYDVTTGFVGYRKKAVQNLVEYKPKSEGYAFLVESKYLLSKAGFLIGECPIIFSERHEGRSKMSYKVIWESIWLPLKLRLQKI